MDDPLTFPRHLPSAGLQASGDRTARIVSGQKTQRLHSRTAAGGVGIAARRAMVFRHSRTSLPGATSGKWATSSCGTIAAPCTAVIPSTPHRAAFCIVPRSRAKPAPPREPLRLEKARRSPNRSGAAVPDLSDLLCEPGQYLDSRAIDEGGPQTQQYAARTRVLGIRHSLRFVPTDRRLDRRQIRAASDPVGVLRDGWDHQRF